MNRLGRTVVGTKKNLPRWFLVSPKSKSLSIALIRGSTPDETLSLHSCHLL